MSTFRNCGSVPPLSSLSCESKNTSPGFGCFQFVHLSQLRLSQSAMARQSSKGSRMNASAKICNANSTNGLVPNVPMQCKVNQYGQCPMCQCKVNQWPASNVPVQSQPMAGVQCISSAHALPITVLNIEATASSLHAKSPGICQAL